MNPARLWYDQTMLARLARGVLAPLSILWREGMRVRNSLYDRGIFASSAPSIPAFSVGNLSVGGTGKTPVAAYVAGELRDRGARPALVLRGYGDDEPLVHALLNPDVPVLTGGDRFLSAREALARGCDVIVLDDAFQHRRVQRTVDLVLIAAEQWNDELRTLPSGPYREDGSALERATMILITRKASGHAEAAKIRVALQRMTRVPIGIAALRLDSLRRIENGTLSCESEASAAKGSLSLEALRGKRVLAIAAIGEPRAFEAQLISAGADVDLAPFADHHAFDRVDVQRLAHRAESKDFVVCTLKDAVKLAPLWARATPSLWYVSQRVHLEEGGEELEKELRRLLDARHAAPTSTTG